MIAAIGRHDSRRHDNYRKTDRKRGPATQQKLAHRVSPLDGFYPGSMPLRVPGRRFDYTLAQRYVKLDEGAVSHRHADSMRVL